MSSKTKSRIIIHGGAGNITRANLPPLEYELHRHSLYRILNAANDLLLNGASAIDAATAAVSLLEDDALFNAGKGAVVNLAGGIELEASIMVSSGKRKRGCAVSLLKRVKNPIKLAAQMLKRGDESLERGDLEGAQGHVHVSGSEAEALAQKWGLEMCDEDYFRTKKRMDEHRRDLKRRRGSYDSCSRDGSLPVSVQSAGNENVLHDSPVQESTEEAQHQIQAYLPQGTVGCVVLDSRGVLAVATSTGGLTNKLPGRIGDTPTFGAGFWAEEWYEDSYVAGSLVASRNAKKAPRPRMSRPMRVLGLLSSCFSGGPTSHEKSVKSTGSEEETHRAVAMSGTGNGDTFLRLSATRTAAAFARFSSPSMTLAACLNWMAGPGGQLQRSAGDRFGHTGEGEGGIIGIEVVNGRSEISYEFNCGGMFRAWFDNDGVARYGVFQDE